MLKHTRLFLVPQQWQKELHHLLSQSNLKKLKIFAHTLKVRNELLDGVFDSNAQNDGL